MASANTGQGVSTTTAPRGRKSRPAAPRRRSRWQTAVIAIAVLAIGYAAREGRAFLIPVVVALLANFLLSPAIRTLGRIGLPRPLAAAIVIIALVALAAGLAFAVAEPVEQWVARAPSALDTAATRLQPLRRTVDEIRQEASEIETAAGISQGGGGRGVGAPGGARTVVQRLARGTLALAAAIVEVVLLSFFLLASGDWYLRKLVSALPNIDDESAAMRVAREIEASLSRYLLTEATINLALGAMVGLALWLLGMPTPWLWGGLACLLAFIPYVGSLSLIVVLAVVAVTTIKSPGRALAVPVIYFAINFLSANVVTPYVLGKRLTLHPFIILAGLAFWASMWGIPGAFLSVPLLATAKIIADEVPSLRRLGELLGGANSATP